MSSMRMKTMLGLAGAASTSRPNTEAGHKNVARAAEQNTVAKILFIVDVVKSVLAKYSSRRKKALIYFGPRTSDFSARPS
jgi:hypothetical protein